MKRARNINYSINFNINSLQASGDPRNSNIPRPPSRSTLAQTFPCLPSILDPRFSAPPPQTQFRPHFSPVPMTNTTLLSKNTHSLSTAPSTSFNLNQTWHKFHHLNFQINPSTDPQHLKCHYALHPPYSLSHIQ